MHLGYVFPRVQFSWYTFHIGKIYHLKYLQPHKRFFTTNYYANIVYNKHISNCIVHVPVILRLPSTSPTSKCSPKLYHLFKALCWNVLNPSAIVLFFLLRVNLQNQYYWEIRWIWYLLQFLNCVGIWNFGVQVFLPKRASMVFRFNQM